MLWSAGEQRGEGGSTGAAVEKHLDIENDHDEGRAHSGEGAGVAELEL